MLAVLQQQRAQHSSPSWWRRLLGLSLGVILGVEWGLPGQAQDLSVAEIVQDAMTAAAAQDWTESADLYRQALELEPNNAGLHNNLGVVLRRQGDLNGAIEAYRRTLELDPSLDAIYVNLAIALLSNQQWQEAITVLEDAQDRAPGEASLSLYRGLALEKLQQWPAAAQAYQTYIQTEPNALGYYRLAIAHWQSGAGSESAEAFRRAARLDPQVGLYSSEAGRALAKLGITQEARAFLERLPQNWPNPADFAILARLAFRLDQLEEAESTLQRAIQLSQDPSGTGVGGGQVPASILNDAGVVSAERQDLDRAVEFLQAAAASVDQPGASPRTGAITYSNLADLYLTQDQVDLALAAAQEAVQRDPSLAQAHNTLAVILLRLERVPEAKASLQRATQLDADYWQAHRNLGIAHALAGEQEQATQSLLTAIDKAPSLDIVQGLNDELLKLQQITPSPPPL